MWMMQGCHLFFWDFVGSHWSKKHWNTHLNKKWSQKM